MAGTCAPSRGVAVLLATALAAVGVVVAGLAGASAAGAVQNPTSANCAATGAALDNAGFEVPSLPGTAVTFLPAAGGLPSWQTTDTAFEVWSNGFGGVVAAQGNQHVELNANIAGTLYQTVPTTPGSIIRWQFAHRARLLRGPPGSAVDTMELLLGPTLAGALSQGQFSDDDLAWTYHSGMYTVPAGQTSTIFAFRAVSTSSGDPAAGNFLDDISFATAPCLTVTTATSDADGGAVQRGDVLTISTTVRNDGYSSASGSVVSAAIPAQTTYLPGSLIVEGSAVTDAAGDDRGEIVGARLTWRVGAGADGAGGGSLAPGSSATVSFQVVVGAGATGTISSHSTADGVWGGSGELATSTSNTAVVALASANLATAKSVAVANLASTIAGAALGYDIATTNAGPDEAVDVVVTDVLPLALLGATVIPDPSVAGGSCVIVTGQATCTYPVLPVGATATTQIVGTLDPSTAPGSSIANTATSLARTDDPDLADNTASVSAGPATAVADLAVTLRYGAGEASDPTTLVPGDAVRLTALVINHGPSASPGSTLVLSLDPAARSWAVVSSAPTSCVSFGARVICSIPVLGSGSGISFAISGVVPAAAPAGTIVMTSSAVVAGTGAPDPVPANDTATATLAVSVLATADLGAVVVLSTPVVAGGPITYLVSTVNAGPSQAVGVVVIDEVPAGVADPIGVPDPGIAGGSCVTQGRTITCTYPVVRPGITVRTTVTGRAEPGLTLATALTNQASARSKTPDPNASNDSALTTADPSVLASAQATARALASTGVETRSLALAGALAALLGAILLVAACRPGRTRVTPGCG